MIKAYIAVSLIGIAGIATSIGAYYFAVIRKRKNWNNYR